MVALYALLGFLLGVLINLLADQLPRWRRLSRVPFCPYCDEPRPAWAWSGTLAYLRLKPDCQHCGAAISWRHPLVELAMAGLFAFMWIRYGQGGPSPLLLPYSIYSAIFVLIFVIDLEHKLILKMVIFPAWILALLGSLIRPQPRFFYQALIGGVLGYGLLWLIYQLGVLFVKVMSRRRGKPINATAFGYGDVRLGGFIGLVLGFPDLLYALFIGILLGGLGALAYLFVAAVILRRYKPFTAIPYGPFLVLGAMWIMFFGV